MRLPFDAWRAGTGPLMIVPLHVRREVTEAQLRRNMDSIKSYSVLRIKARLATNPTDKSPIALLERILGPSDDKELLAESKRLQKPVHYRDKSLGVFLLNRQVNWFQTRTKWNGATVDLRLKATLPPELTAATKAARSLCRDAAKWDRRARTFAASKLLKTYNDGWRQNEDGDETPALNSEQFCARMTPESLTVNPDGSFDIWYKDGDLFWDHAITVEGTLAGGLSDAGIAG